MKPSRSSRRTFLKSVGLAASATVFTSQATAAERPAAHPSDQDFVEVVGGPCGSECSLVELNDGSLLTSNEHRSADGGRTWTATGPFGDGVRGAGLLRLQSGKLALVSPIGYESGRIWLSADEGHSWAPCGETTPGGPAFELGDTMIQLDSGRLLRCWDYNIAGDHPGLEYNAVMAYGMWKGHRFPLEGHGHLPEFFAAGFSWSDDEGRTWSSGTSLNMPNILMGWFDENGEPNGTQGVTPCGESSIVQTNDGRVLIFGRSTIGRIVQSYSTDGGQRWHALRPTDLAASNSPPRLRRIPKSGDLLCVWNQVSGEEIRRGFRRGRLSSGISKDNGRTWEHFRTIQVCEGLDQVARVQPDRQVKPVRARKDVGVLPDGYAYYHYPNVTFVGDKVYLMYSRGYPKMGNAEQSIHQQEQVLRIYPLDWFYSG